jgi:hypothetical protein
MAECSKTGVSLFVKQLGAKATDCGRALTLKDSHGGDWAEWPDDLRVRQVPSSVPERKPPVPPIALPGANGRPNSQAGLSELRASQTAGGDEPNRLFIRMSEVIPKKKEWYWHLRIPRGELTMVDGDPGNAKSTMALDLAARTSTGRKMPDGTEGSFGGVILVVGEDSIEKTVWQRLHVAKADKRRIVVLKKDLIRLPDDLEMIRIVAAQIKAALLIIDPLMESLVPDAKSDQKVRQALGPLKHFAEHSNVAVLMVRHLVKRGGVNAMYRGSGSIGIIAACRSGLLVGKCPDDPNLSVLCQFKSNLGPIAPSLLFEPVECLPEKEVRIEWRGQCDYTSQDLLASPAAQQRKLGEAMEFLTDLLANGPVRQKEIERKAIAEGIAVRTLERARETLGVISKRKGWGPGSACYWRLPDPEDASGEAAS